MMHAGRMLFVATVCYRGDGWFEGDCCYLLSLGSTHVQASADKTYHCQSGVCPGLTPTPASLAEMVEKGGGG